MAIASGEAKEARKRRATKGERGESRAPANIAGLLHQLLLRSMGIVCSIPLFGGSIVKDVTGVASGGALVHVRKDTMLRRSHCLSIFCLFAISYSRGICSISRGLEASPIPVPSFAAFFSWRHAIPSTASAYPCVVFHRLSGTFRRAKDIIRFMDCVAVHYFVRKERINCLHWTSACITFGACVWGGSVS